MFTNTQVVVTKVDSLRVAVEAGVQCGKATIQVRCNSGKLIGGADVGVHTSWHQHGDAIGYAPANYLHQRHHSLYNEMVNRVRKWLQIKHSNAYREEIHVFSGSVSPGARRQVAALLNRPWILSAARPRRLVRGVYVWT